MVCKLLCHGRTANRLLEDGCHDVEMVTLTRKRRRGATVWLYLSPWAILGSLAILAPIAFVLVSTSIARDRENMTRLMVEKGAALIRSFEAGARTGMIGMGWGGNQVERLLVETAKQPDILYLVITDEGGTALAHSSPDRIKATHRTAVAAGLQGLREVKWHYVETDDGLPAFEVYSRFRPIPGPPGHVPGRRRGREMAQGRIPPGEQDEICDRPGAENMDWCRLFLEPPPGATHPSYYIFVGLDTAPLETARKEAKRSSLIMTAGVLLIGFAGMVSLFMAQGYKVARRSLAKVSAFSDQVVENLPVGLVASDENGLVAAYNEAAETILGEKAYNTLYERAESVLPSQLWGLTKRLQSRKMIIEEDIECKVNQNTSLPLQVSAALLEEDNGSFLGYVFMFRDLTEVRKLKQELERSRRLASLGDLAAGVAHEIRNPLSSIKGFATYFKEWFNDRPAERETATTMIQEVERLDRVIGQLLEFARPSSLKISPVDLRELVNHSLRLIETDANIKGIRVQSHIAADLPPILMDGDRISQVLLNLYLNAIQAMKKGGVLEIDVTRNEDARETSIAVSDTGPGMTADDQERIFDPYFTTKSNGTGLGLAIVHKIMEAHGGDVVVKSIPGQGTTVVLVLPDYKELPRDGRDGH